MDKGTKIRSICLAIVLINQANVSLGQADFGNETINIIYRVGSYLLTVAAAFAAWYYNNSTTEAGAIGTGITRQIKQELSDGYQGERFFTSKDGELLRNLTPTFYDEAMGEEYGDDDDEDDEEIEEEQEDE